MKELSILNEERDTIMFLIKDMSENSGDYPMRSHTRTYILESYMTRLVQVDKDIRDAITNLMHERSLEPIDMSADDASLLH